jgi:hypothetical protein
MQIFFLGFFKGYFVNQTGKPVFLGAYELITILSIFSLRILLTQFLYTLRNYSHDKAIHCGFMMKQV